MGKLDGKVAVVTGGASGLGEASVRLFLKEGARVVIADIQDEKGERLAEEVGPAAFYRHTDVSREGDVEACVQLALERFGRLDCMFNNAGIPGVPGVSGRIEEIPVEGFDGTMGILLRGVFLGMKHAAPVMKKQESGSIINTSSTGGVLAGDADHVYAAAKAAVIHMTRSVSLELGESNVRVNCICPGCIATPIVGIGVGLSREVAEQNVDGLQAFLPSLQPIKRSGLPEDIARAALWLASEDSSFVNGHALVVDGGFSAGRQQWSVREQMFSHLRDLIRGE